MCACGKPIRSKGLCSSCYMKAWRKRNPAHVVAYRKQWAAEHKAERSVAIKKWNRKNRERKNELTKRWKRRHPEWWNTPTKRLNLAVSRGIWGSLNGEKGTVAWQRLVGYTLKDLKVHLERQFRPGMSWDNYGQWHVDHIKPINTFTFDSARDPGFYQCWGLANLRPLWAVENLSRPRSGGDALSISFTG